MRSSSRGLVTVASAEVRPFHWVPGVSGTNGGLDPETSAAADRLTAEQLESAQAAREQAAFDNGFAQGERAGFTAAREPVEALERRLTSTLEQLSHLRATIAQQAERDLARLALAIAKRILHREVSLDPQLLAVMAHVALDRFGDSSSAIVHLHPDDHGRLGAPGGADDPAGKRASVQCVADPSIEPGGCLVRSELGTVDVSPDAQIREVSRALLGEASASFELPADGD